MITIDEARVDRIRLDLLNLGHSWAESNRMAVDMYLKEGILQEKLRKHALAELARMPYNTAQRAVRMRPTQTAWRQGANIRL